MLFLLMFRKRKTLLPFNMHALLCKGGLAYLVVLINKVQATVTGHERRDLLAVLDELHTVRRKGENEREKEEEKAAGERGWGHVEKNTGCT